VFVKTYGCTSNKFDSEVMIGLIQNENYKIVDNENDADYILVNTCGVKSVTEEKIISYLQKLSKTNKKVLIAGCLTKINFERIKKAIPNYWAILEPKTINRITDAIKNGGIYFSNGENIEKLLLPKIDLNQVIGIIKISEGCLSNCTFCATKISRGRVKSYRPEIIRECIRNGISNGKKEFYLTSEDCSAYGRDIGINLIDLLETISKIDGKFFVRVGMMNPLHFKKMEVKELAEKFNSEKIFKFLHLCVQSGSNKVLKDMKRGYTVEDFMNYVKIFRETLGNLTLETDIIVGYPTESEKDFKSTVKLIKKVKPDIVNISKFSKRPNTEASHLKEIDSKIVKERSRKLTKIVKKVSERKNKEWLGWRGEVIIDEVGKKKNTFIGRNYCYKPIVVESRENIIGKFVKVEVYDFNNNSLFATILQ